jgi:hypothetical protein
LDPIVPHLQVKWIEGHLVLPCIPQIHKLLAPAALLHVLHQLHPHSSPLLHLWIPMGGPARLVMLALLLLLLVLGRLLLLLVACRWRPTSSTAGTDCGCCCLLGMLLVLQLLLGLQRQVRVLECRQLPTRRPAAAAAAAVDANLQSCTDLTCGRTSIKDSSTIGGCGCRRAARHGIPMLQQCVLQRCCFNRCSTFCCPVG